MTKITGAKKFIYSPPSANMKNDMNIFVCFCWQDKNEEKIERCGKNGKLIVVFTVTHFYFFSFYIRFFSLSFSFFARLHSFTFFRWCVCVCVWEYQRGGEEGVLKEECKGAGSVGKYGRVWRRERDSKQERM